jgi:hypothetical protein
LTSSQESADSALDSKEPGCEQSGSAKSIPTAKPSCGSVGQACLYGTTSSSSQAEISATLPTLPTPTGGPTTPLSATLLLEDSPVRTSATPACEQEYQGNDQDFGASLPVWLATYDRDGSSWKTFPPSSDEASTRSSVTWSRSGMTQGGIAFQLPTLARPITGTESGLLPTPSGVNGGKNHTVGRLDEWGGNSNPFRGTDIGKWRCASFEEWMMGLPIGFTELTASETPSSRKSRK